MHGKKEGRAGGRSFVPNLQGVYKATMHQIAQAPIYTFPFPLSSSFFVYIHPHCSFLLFLPVTSSLLFGNMVSPMRSLLSDPKLLQDFKTFLDEHSHGDDLKNDLIFVEAMTQLHHESDSKKIESLMHR